MVFDTSKEDFLSESKSLEVMAETIERSKANSMGMKEILIEAIERRTIPADMRVFDMIERMNGQTNPTYVVDSLRELSGIYADMINNEVELA